MSVLSHLIPSGFKGELGAHVSPFTVYMVRIQGELGAHVSPFTTYMVRIQGELGAHVSPFTAYIVRIQGELSYGHSFVVLTVKAIQVVILSRETVMVVSY